MHLQKFKSVQNVVKSVKLLVDQTMLISSYAWKLRNETMCWLSVVN